MFCFFRNKFVVSDEKTTMSKVLIYTILVLSCLPAFQAIYSANLRFGPIHLAERTVKSLAKLARSRNPNKLLGIKKFNITTHIAWSLDKAYVTARYTGAPHFRQDGWGFNPLDANDPVYLDIKSRVRSLTQRKDPKHIDILWDGDERLHGGVLLRDGHFNSPGTSALPKEAHTAHFRAVWPLSNSSSCPMLVILPPNGDEHYDRRFKSIARHLALEHHIGSVLLIPPFCASRRTAIAARGKPLRKGQLASVAQLLLTGLVSAEETRSLMHWLRGRGHALIGVCGASFGCFTACVAAAASNVPVAVAACLPCHSAEVCWTDSVMAAVCDFRRLAEDLDAMQQQQEEQGTRLGTTLDNQTAALGLASVISNFNESVPSLSANNQSGHGGWSAEAARQLLRGILSELTDLRRFPPPVLTAAAVLVSARHDGYIATDSAAALHRHWAGAELRQHSGGHVTSFLFSTRRFRRACADAVARLRQFGPCAPFSARLFVDDAESRLLLAATAAARTGVGERKHERRRTRRRLLRFI